MTTLLPGPTSVIQRPESPRFPVALFTGLARVSPRRDLAWDCATGRGAAAINLAAFFRLVVASDARNEAIAAATPHARVRYVVERAERTSLAASSVDLVVVAQALHWLDVDAFYSEARRVLRPGGAIAVWSYGDCTVHSGIDAELARTRARVEGHWGPQRDLVASAYGTIPFPFVEVRMPRHHLLAVWTLPELLWHVRSWQATRAYLAERGDDATEDLLAPLARAWGDPQRRRPVAWPIHLRVGRSDEPPRG